MQSEDQQEKLQAPVRLHYPPLFPEPEFYQPVKQEEQLEHGRGKNGQGKAYSNQDQGILIYPLVYL
jgi:hypothetical protein